MIIFNNPIKNRKPFREALRVTWYEFAEVTAIHGLRYIIDKQGNTFTRLILFVLSMPADASKVYFCILEHYGSW